MGDFSKVENLGEPGDSNFAKLFGKVFDLVRLTGMAASQSLKLKDASLPSHLCIGIAVVGGGLSLVCEAVTPPDTEATADHALFGAILSALAMRPAKVDKETMAAEFSFGPDVILDALQMFERATGRNPDKLLLQPMVRAARDMEKIGAEPLAAFMQGRSASKL